MQPVTDPSGNEGVNKGNRFKSDNNRFRADNRFKSKGAESSPGNSSKFAGREVALLKVGNDRTPSLTGSPSAPSSAHASMSTDMLKEHLVGGIGSVERAQQLWNLTVEYTQRSLQDLDQIRDKNRALLNETYTTLTEMQKKLRNFANEKIDSIGSGKPVTQEDINEFRFLSDLCKSVSDRSVEATGQYITLQEAYQTTMVKGYAKSLDLLYQRRVEEIAWLGQMLNVVQQQEDHENVLKIAYVDQQLKAESHYYDQALAIVRAKEEIGIKQREIALKEGSADHQRELNLVDRAIELYKFKNDIIQKVEKESTLGVSGEKSGTQDLSEIDKVKRELTPSARISMLEYKLKQEMDHQTGKGGHSSSPSAANECKQM